MVIETEMDLQQCRQALRDALDSRKVFKEERYTGWVKGKLFSMSYGGDKETAEKGRWAYNKAMGFLSERDGKTRVHAVIFRGLSDPVSLLVLYAIFLIVFLLIQERWHATLADSLVFSLLAAASISCITYMATAFGEVGRQETETLRRHLTGALQKRPPEEKNAAGAE